MSKMKKKKNKKANQPKKNQKTNLKKVIVRKLYIIHFVNKHKSVIIYDNLAYYIRVKIAKLQL